RRQRGAGAGRGTGRNRYRPRSKAGAGGEPGTCGRGESAAASGFSRAAFRRASPLAQRGRRRRVTQGGARPAAPAAAFFTQAGAGTAITAVAGRGAGRSRRTAAAGDVGFAPALRHAGNGRAAGAARYLHAGGRTVTATFH